MKSTLIQIFAIYGVVCFVGLMAVVAVFGPATYRFLRDEYKGKPLFVRPVWPYQLRRWFLRECKEIRNQRDQVGGFLFVITVLGLLALGLIASCPA